MNSIKAFYTPKRYPVFSSLGATGKIVCTKSFKVALAWDKMGREVMVLFCGKCIGKMTMGAPIMGLDEVYSLDHSEPYGTVHYAQFERSYYINLPDELLEKVGE